MEIENVYLYERECIAVNKLHQRPELGQVVERKLMKELVQTVEHAEKILVMFPAVWSRIVHHIKTINSKYKCTIICF